jgi:hypothetical protein
MIFMKSIFFLLFACSMAAGCRSEADRTGSEIRLLMKDLYKKKISFPLEMEVLTDGNISAAHILSASLANKYKIVHFFTADCDKCINELKKIRSALEGMEKNSAVDLVFIASAPTKVYVQDAIRKIRFP